MSDFKTSLKPLAVPYDIIYVYDGSFNGFLCCVHESVYSGKIPMDIAVEEPITLFEVLFIETDDQIAGRVLKSIPKKISPEALNLIKTVFLRYCHPHDILSVRTSTYGVLFVSGRIEKLS